MPSLTNNFLTHTMAKEIGYFTNLKELYVYQTILQGTYHDRIVYLNILLVITQ